MSKEREEAAENAKIHGAKLSPYEQDIFGLGWEVRNNVLRGVLHSREFYELMQTYRHMPMDKQREVSEQYAKIQDWLLALKNRGQDE